MKMMETIRQKLKHFWDRVAYRLSGRHKYVHNVHIRILTVPTQKKADIIEVEIRRKLEEQLLVIERSNLEVLLCELKDKRRKI